MGAIGTGVVTAPVFGGVGAEDYDLIGQTLIQGNGVLVTIVWCGVLSAILFIAINKTLGLRVREEEERQGLDISSHGERAYNS